MTRILRINIPFITGRCDYYGRPLYRDTPPAVKHAYLDALLAEARSLAADIEQPFEQICFTNGAIGTIEADRLRAFLRELEAILPFAPDCTTTAEVDPGLLSTALAGELNAAHTSLLRFYYATSNAIESERLERPSSVIEMTKTIIVLESAELLRRDMQVLVGFAGQTENSLLGTLREAVLASGVVHCTLVPAAGEMAADAATAAQLYRVAAAFLEEHGFARYTPTCFGKDGFRIAEETQRHTDAAVVSLGPSTVSYSEGLTWANTGDIDAYITHADNPEAIVAYAAEDTAAVVAARETVRKLYALQGVSAEAPCIAALLEEGLLKTDEHNAASLSAAGCLAFDAVATRIMSALAA